MRRAPPVLALALAACGALALAACGALALAACGGPAPTAPDAAPDAPAACVTDERCDDGVFCNGVERCASGACVLGEAPCIAGQTCDEPTDSCETDCAIDPDADGDGARARECGGEDCDDTDRLVGPSAVEVCDPDGVDEDCDPRTFGERDDDGDGAFDAACCNGTTCGDDCDDGRSGTHPGEAEECNGIDDDCNGAIDEGVTTTFARDADRDGHGDGSTDAEVIEACAAPEGYVASADDCDDDEGSIHPGALDRCDGAVDDDCSGTVDDPPGGCACRDGDSRTCPLPGVCAASAQSCTAGVWAACGIEPAASETCGNSIDDDCDGAIDDGCGCTEAFRVCGIDEGACTRGVQRCSAAGAWGACEGSTHPTPELCDGEDDDCDGRIDEGVSLRCWPDGDGDGYAWASAVPTEACGTTCPVGTTSREPAGMAETDCDDGDSFAHPGQTEFASRPRLTVGGFDHDCDGTIAYGGVTGGCRRRGTDRACTSSWAWSDSAPTCGQDATVAPCVWDDALVACISPYGCSPSPGTTCQVVTCH